VTAPAQDLLEAAAEIVSLVALARGTVRDEHADRVVTLERAVIAAAVRGHLDAWGRELVDVEAFGTPGRALAWLCVCRAADELGADLRRARVSGRGAMLGARRPCPWDVARLVLVTVPRGTLATDELQELLRDAADELDAAERSPRVLRPLDALQAERRRAQLFDLLLPALVALDGGQVPTDLDARLRAALALTDGAAAPSRRAA